MLDAKFIRENLDYVTEKLALRGPGNDLGPFKELDEKRRALIQSVDEMKARRNTESAEIGKLKKAGGDATSQQEAVRALGEQIKEGDEQLKEVNGQLSSLLMTLPNLPHESVPVGTDESDNRVERMWGDSWVVVFGFSPFVDSDAMIPPLRSIFPENAP